MPIRFYNTLTRRKQFFLPLDPGNVRLYVCGPTVYGLAHIGNARPVVDFDVLFRLLHHHYGADHVPYVRNVTDVDDKIIAAAMEAGSSLRALVKHFERIPEADVPRLQIPLGASLIYELDEQLSFAMGVALMLALRLALEL